MQAQLTEFLLRVTFNQSQNQLQTSEISALVLQSSSLTSKEIINHIYLTLNSEKNYKVDRCHRLSLSSDDTNPQSPIKCNCKKSKCLKLYCECFARGSFCKGCNCDCCQNTQQFGEIRAKAIDEMIGRVSMPFIPFGPKSSSMKGCNCRKTGCKKKYCECYNSGNACNQFCKCCNCQNHM